MQVAREHVRSFVLQGARGSILRAAFATCAALILVGCGSRTPLDGDAVLEAPIDEPRDASIDRAPIVDPPSPNRPDAPPNVLPAGYVCFGDVTHVRGVSCSGTSSGSAASCTGTLNCDDGHQIIARCANGICECENVKFNTCYCEVTPGLDYACGVGNCCWR